jgi:hypothetical protein
MIGLRAVLTRFFGQVCLSCHITLSAQFYLCKKTCFCSEYATPPAKHNIQSPQLASALVLELTVWSTNDLAMSEPLPDSRYHMKRSGHRDDRESTVGESHRWRSGGSPDSTQLAHIPFPSPVPPSPALSGSFFAEKRVLFVTDNSTKSRYIYKKFDGLGIEAHIVRISPQFGVPSPSCWRIYSFVCCMGRTRSSDQHMRLLFT